MSFIKPVLLRNIPERKKSISESLQDTLCEFDHSNYEAVEYIWQPMGYKNINSAISSMYGAIKRSGRDIVAIKRADHIYLVRKENT